ncbi:MAG: hypothetical protein GPJ50_15590 [Candidatus Heimdallarchaeota archaeon]|nr:hypothetical protein [Candidatus Heimdallarchaeota archaeon]
MTDAYFVHDDNYQAMKEDRDRHNGQKKAIQEFNRNLEQKLAEAEDEELASMLTWSSVPTTGIKPKLFNSKEDSD